MSTVPIEKVNQSKPKNVKIIQIAVGQGPAIGLGSDNKLYYWDSMFGKWLFFKV